jgi:hypothetical protein
LTVISLVLSLAAAAATPPPACVAPDDSRIVLELALTDAEKAQGLMFRDALAADRGMLFVFPTDGIHPFWMKNTFIPLDMVWLSAAGAVVEVRADVPPCRLDPCPSYANDRPARAVLELAAGTAARHRIAPGAALRCSGVPGFPAEAPSR